MPTRHRRVSAITPFLLLGCIVFGTAAPSPAQQTDTEAPDGTEPFESDVVERTERRLIQLDVSLRPKKNAADLPMPTLSVDELELVISGRRILLRYADRICRTEAEPSTAETGETTAALEVPAEPSPPSSAPSVPAPPPATFVFYLDHGLLNMSGQATALTMARKLIRELIVDGARGFVISSGMKLEQSPLTDDPDILIAFLDEQGQNPSQWLEIAWFENEMERYAEIQRVKNTSGEQAALTRAQMFMRLEQGRVARRINRLAATIGSLTQLDPPKSVIYFADALRRNAGFHYARLLGVEDDAKFRNLTDLSHTFDRITMTAGEHNVRIYTVQSEGVQFVQSKERAARIGVPKSSGSLGRVDAIQAMRIVAAETGGEMFFGGTGGATFTKMRDRIQSDFRCFYLLSFYPEDLKVDSALGVLVRFNPDAPRYAELDGGYRIRARGQLVVQSESRRKESLLLAAHAVSGTVDAMPGHSALIPLGFEDGRYRALVQFEVRNLELPDELVRQASWELGMTHVGREKMIGQVDRWVQVSDPSVPVVLQVPWEFRPGINEIVSVGYENRLSQMATSSLEMDWPDPDGQPAVIAPISLVQEAEAIFVEPEGDATHTSSALGLGGRPADSGREAWLVSIVCRGKRQKGELRLERMLDGALPIAFKPRAWPYLKDERCITVRDFVRPDHLTSGDYRYSLRVRESAEPGARPLAMRDLTFRARPTEALQAPGH